MQTQPVAASAGYLDGSPYYPPTQLPESASYPGYASDPGLGQNSGAPPPGYSYSPSSDGGFVGHPPVGQPTVGYQQVHTDQAGIYQIPGTPPGVLPPAGGFAPPSLQQVQPGYPTAPYTSAPYEPTGYPTRSYEVDPYPADPYAVDPYGYPGSGPGRLLEQVRDDRPWYGGR
jgi:hypothetical protein